MSPSPSTSAGYTEFTPSADVEITCSVNVGWAEMIEKVIKKVKKIRLLDMKILLY
jgi:hypothetical protein